MMATDEWAEWEQHWRGARTSPADLDVMIARTRRARRGLWLMRRLSTVLALVALAVVGAALRHAANGVEATLGIVVSIGIVAVWIADGVNQRSAADRVEAPEEEYRAVRRALCIRQMRFATLGWIVAALDIVFLVPWWIGGFTVHGVGFHMTQLISLWGPLALIVGFLSWVTTLRRRARVELARVAERDWVGDTKLEDLTM
jgi:hypothetical protein